MKLYRFPKTTDWAVLSQRPALDSKSLFDTVGNVMQTVKQQGDAALKLYTERFDGVKPNNLQVDQVQIEKAQEQVPEKLKSALQTAAKNIETFHKAQLKEEAVVETMPGVRCWRRQTPIEKVGLYIPGGTAPLFSTVLMLAIPARIAGCREVILCTPPNKTGDVHPAILYAAQLSGITQIYKVGGAQAIAAMTYGTESIPMVYKLFGPGNQYVTAAKQLATLEGTAIDMPAGPSEVLVLGDQSANPEFIAADLLSQAEHGLDSQSVFVCWHEGLPALVKQAVEKQLTELPRRKMAEKSLENSKLIQFKHKEEAFAFVNFYAPEHLILSIEEAEQQSTKITNAGSVFLGNYTPESAGDYASGTNHTLPTNAYARMYSGVSTDSFLKQITFQSISRKALSQIGPVIEEMAAAELLDAHKQAVSIRLKS